MKRAAPAAFSIDFDEYDLRDPLDVERIRQRASDAIDAIDVVVVESGANFSLQLGVAQQFVSAAELQLQTMTASYHEHRAALDGARASADAVVQFARRLAASLATPSHDRPTEKMIDCDRDRDSPPLL